jgi:hypothetical protein
MLANMGRKKSVVPDGVPGEILKLGGEAMIPFLASILEISLNNTTIPSDWKRSIVFPVYKGVDRSAVANFIAGYLRQVLDRNVWLYEG